MEGKWSAQEIVGRAITLADYYYRRDVLHEDITMDIREREKLLRAQILSWGGVAAINAWLAEHDRFHTRLENIKYMKWDFLDENSA